MRQRLQDILVVLFIVSVLALNYPLLALFNHAILWLGIPLLYLYILIVWLTIILLTAYCLEGIEAHTTTSNSQSDLDVHPHSH